MAEGASELKIVSKFDELTRNARIVQLETLQRILQLNARCEYLQRSGLNSRTDVESFKSCLPVITYKDIEGEVQRIAQGDKSPILTAEPVEYLSISSGTSSGKPKLIPMKKDFFFTTMRMFQTSGEFRSREFPIDPYGKVLDIVYCGKLSLTEGGVKVGTGTTLYFKSRVFKLKQQAIRTYNSSPEAVVHCLDVHQATYAHLLFALLNARDIQFISSTFLYTILQAFQVFQDRWKELSADIERGSLAPWITDPCIRAAAATSHLFYPNPMLAKFVRDECSKGLEGIIPRLWTNAKYIYSIITGSMEVYVPNMRYYAGRLPLVAGDYGASETWIAVNLNPLSSAESTHFTVVPDLAYFEFIPTSRDKSYPVHSTFAEHPPVGLSEVKVDEEYEIVVTTFAGLYRYRLGDIVRITGFYNSAPQFQYVRRRDVLLNIHIDKVTERDIQAAFDKSEPLIRKIGLEVADYTSYARISTTSPGNYVIFVEFTGKLDANIPESEVDSVLEDFCSSLDRAFVEPGYVVSRAAGTIGPLELCVVERRTFGKLVEYALHRGGTMNQYKTPRCIANQQMLNILSSGISKTYHSTSHSQRSLHA